MKPKLKSFIETAKAKGKSAEWVKEKLTAAGWSGPEIAEALDELRRGSQASQKHHQKSPQKSHETRHSGVSINQDPGFAVKARDKIERTLRIYKKKVSEPVVEILGEDGQSRMGYDIVEADAHEDPEKTKKIHSYQNSALPPPLPKVDLDMEAKIIRVRMTLIGTLCCLLAVKGVLLAFF